MAKYRKRKRRAREFTFIALAVALVGCGALAVVGVILAAAVTDTSEPPVSENFQPAAAEARTFDQITQDAEQQARETGLFNLSFDEEQISSWMSLEGKKWAEARGYPFPFENIQVGLDDGVIRVEGDVHTSGMTFPLRVVVRPGIDGAGHLSLKVETAKLGQVGVPEFLLDSLTQQIEDLIARPFRDVSGSYTIFGQTLVIENGRFSVQGSVQ